MREYNLSGQVEIQIIYVPPARKWIILISPQTVVHVVKF
jgi:hypothetical protein